MRSAKTDLCQCFSRSRDSKALCGKESLARVLRASWLAAFASVFAYTVIRVAIAALKVLSKRWASES